MSQKTRRAVVYLRIRRQRMCAFYRYLIVIRVWILKIVTPRRTVVVENVVLHVPNTRIAASPGITRIGPAVIVSTAILPNPLLRSET